MKLRPFRWRPLVPAWLQRGSLAFLHGTDETKLTDDAKVMRAQHAETLLRDPLLNGAWEELERDYLRSFYTSPVAEVQAREDIYRCLGMLRGVRAQFEAFVSDGRVIDRERALRAKERAMRHPIR